MMMSKFEYNLHDSDRIPVELVRSIFASNETLNKKKKKKKKRKRNDKRGHKCEIWNEPVGIRVRVGPTHTPHPFIQTLQTL